jgi:hypothetical protein
MAENVEAVGSAESEGAEASPEKVGFSPVSGRSGANIGARIGDTEDAPLKCRLRLDQQRAARGWKSRRKGESWRGWGFAVMETEPGAKELIAGARRYLYGN